MLYRALIVLLFISVAGCDRASQHIDEEVFRQGESPEASPTRPNAVPALVEDRENPADELPRRPEANAAGRIGATQAIKIAEQFVRDNGYTEYVPPDSSKLTPESIEWSGRADWISHRRNTLRPKALGCAEGARNDENGWTVGFERVDPSDRGTGRAVTMDARGGSVRMQHVDYILSRLKPRSE